MDWNELLASLDRCLVSEEAEEQERADREPQDDEPQAERQEEVLSELNQKLIEIHSRLKSLAGGDLEEEDEITSPSSSGTELADMNSNRQVSPQVAQEIVLRCGMVLSQRGKLHSHSLAAQLLAELGRGEVGRGICLKDGTIVKKLEGALGEQSDLKTGSVEATVQMCRILGNLCYNCKEGRQQIMRTKCLEHIYSVAKNRSRIEKEDLGQRFPVIVPGFLLNFCNENPEGIQIAGRVGFVKVIVDNILSTKTNDAVFNSSLNFLVTVAEDDSGHQYINEANRFPEALDHILKHTSSPEVTETTLELIRSIADDPQLTLQLAKNPICNTIVEHIVGRWRSPEFQDHRSDACDLLVLILSHDDSMKQIYSIDNGKFFNIFRDWLEKEDMQLKVAASLAIGNFACSEENCDELMQKNISQTLIGLLRNYQNPMNDLKLQHALLGTIRNLAVSKKTRKELLDQGLLEPCLNLVDKLGQIGILTAQPVIFKLLATLRLVIDGNPEAAVTIGSNQSILTTLSQWGATETQALNAESARLMAALIKHSNSRQVMNNIVACGGLAHVSAMIVSSHVRMVNEALVSLSVFSVAVERDTVQQQLYTDLIINGLKSCVSSGDNVPIEVKKNALTLTRELLKLNPEVFSKMLNDLNFSECLKNVESLKTEYPTIFDFNQ